jgi:hypothetical protein
MQVLNETPGADLVLADVYSFGTSVRFTLSLARATQSAESASVCTGATGIILWELLTRQQPYAGLRCAFLSAAPLVFSLAH